MRILVVEDEADLNLLLCKVLTKAGYTVDGCLDGEDAQAHLLGATYDGILLAVMTTIWSNPLTLPSCWPVSGP